MNYKLLATDIDGTITDEKGRIHTKALDAIRKLEAKGIQVMLVSGRPLPFVESLSLFAGTSGPVVAENGAVAKINGELKTFGNPKLAQEALKKLQQVFPLELDDDNGYRMVDVSVKMTVDPNEIQAFIEKEGIPVNLLVTNVMFHLVDAQVSKGKTVVTLLNQLGIKPEETVVSGDSYNDMPLFEIGAYNLAVGNAADDLKKKANLVADSLYGAGFAEMVTKVFNLG